MLSHRNLIVTARNAAARERLREDEEVLSYLPMAWVGDHVFSYAQSIVARLHHQLPGERGHRARTTCRRSAPPTSSRPPRIWENILTSVMIRVDDAALAEARDGARSSCAWPRSMERTPPRRRGRARCWQRPALSARPACWCTARSGTTSACARVRRAYTAGEAIGPEIFVFFRALGVNVKQLYGMTEASVFVTIQRDGDVRLDTVGHAAPGRRDPHLGRRARCCSGARACSRATTKNPEATRQTLEDGWIHSGDAGFLDHDGHLKIIDRAKDVSRLADGTMFAPKYPREQAQVLAVRARRRSASVRRGPS